MEYGIKVNAKGRDINIDFNNKFITKVGKITVNTRRFQRPIIMISNWEMNLPDDFFETNNKNAMVIIDDNVKYTLSHIKGTYNKEKVKIN
ncbi:hypothetical protein LCGC14_2223490 [marine sediment metagenome]|uniref:Uncharacterized protein n=1 Tax=marine sediment metagenome TaxID=412755 RepID=A0A0F9G5S2_9ZZZZ